MSDDVPVAASPSNEIEIYPIDKPARQSRRSSGGESDITPAMRVALRASTVVFHLGALIQVTLALWIALVAGLTTGAGGILGRTRGLDGRTFSTSLVAAIVLDGLLFLGIGLVWLERFTRAEEAESRRASFTERHPVVGAALWLVGALCVTTAAAWWPSAYFPESWTTVVVLANVIFFALVGAVVTSSALAKVLEAIRVRSLASRYRAGAVTAALLVLGLTGGASWLTGWQEELKDDGVRELGLGRVSSASSLTDGAVRALCIADDEIDPDRARSAAAPACSFLTKGGAGRDAGDGGDSGALNELWEKCFRLLQPTFPTTRDWLRREFPIAPDDADDAVSYAAEETCLRDTPPEKPYPYFRKAAWRKALRIVEKTRRSIPCDELETLPAPWCDPADSKELRAKYALVVWDRMKCTLAPRHAEVVHRKLLLGEDYPQIAEAMGLARPAQAKHLYEYAIDKLREAGVANCLFE